MCLLKFNIHNWLCTLNSNLIHICSVTMVRDCAIMGAIPYMGFSAFAIESTQDKVLACASTKFTLATVVVGGVWKSQHFTNNIGVGNVPRTRCVISTISVAERAIHVEDLSPIGARLQIDIAGWAGLLVALVGVLEKNRPEVKSASLPLILGISKLFPVRIRLVQQVDIGDSSKPPPPSIASILW